MNLALLQLPPLAPNDVRLSKYLQSCKKQKVHLAAFGEYVFSPFYRDVLKDARFYKECNTLINALKKLSHKYKLDIVAPVIHAKEDKLYKSIALIQQESVQFYYPQRLMAYSHWNERDFFDNALPKSPKTPLIFEKDGCKIALVSGFEVHFDEIWLKLKRAGVDVVIMPCSNTFASQERWRILTQARAFNNNMVILRINRIGELAYDGAIWRFYGDSLFVNADGHIEDSLEEREGVMIIELQSEQIKDIQKQWGFRA